MPFLPHFSPANPANPLKVPGPIYEEWQAAEATRSPSFCLIGRILVVRSRKSPEVALASMTAMKYKGNDVKSLSNQVKSLLNLEGICTNRNSTWIKMTLLAR